MDPIADMLVCIQNAQAVSKDQVTVPFSAMKMRIASILKQSGFISEVEQRNKKDVEDGPKQLVITLRYEEKRGQIQGFRRISRLSRRMYIKAAEIRPVRSGEGIAVLSTPQGILSSVEARKKGVGGEILFEIW